ncbi:MAG: hypothetical protein DBX36_00435 [Oscillospiraceae bacterium]|jgi:hypothetical protein|nr:MAG: hypothetical protein DBX36_00435 [Oscillospiraceae bacterium]
MPAVTKNRIREKTERKTFITERTREYDSIIKHDKSRSGIILQYKLIVTTDESGLGDTEYGLYNKVYSLLIIKTLYDTCGSFDETVFIYDITRSEDAAEKLLHLLSENFVTPEEAKDIIDDIL